MIYFHFDKVDHKQDRCDFEPTTCCILHSTDLIKQTKYSLEAHSLMQPNFAHITVTGDSKEERD